MQKEGTILRSYAEKNNIGTLELAKKLNISKQGLYQLYKSKAFAPDTIARIEKALQLKWGEVKGNIEGNVPRETKQEAKEAARDSKPLELKAVFELAESNRLLAEANKSIADSNRDLAASNLILARNNEDMVKTVIAGAPLQTPLDVAARFAEVLVLIAQVGSGEKKWKSTEQGLAEIHKLVPLPQPARL